MIPYTASLFDHVGGQLRQLSKLFGLTGEADQMTRVLGLLLGPPAMRPRNAPPWESDISDDHTPVEFSVAVDDHDGRYALRTMVEPTAARPSANLALVREVLGSLSDEFGLSLERFDAVSDLFLRGPVLGRFAVWLSIVLSEGSRPEMKVYFNPAARGEEHAPFLVRESLYRLGFPGAYHAVEAHALRRGPLDRLSFFAVDLHEHSHARVKVYASHQDAYAEDMEHVSRAAGCVPPGTVTSFCELVGGSQGPFRGRPLVSSLAFVDGDTDRASNFSLYHPIRSYVRNDLVARERVLQLLERHDISPDAVLDALAVVASRELTDGSGLIPHVSLRLGHERRGVTVYLSSGAYSHVGQVVVPT